MDSTEPQLAFQVTIPPGSKPGSSLRLRAPNGVLVDFVIPSDAEPGQVVQIEVPQIATPPPKTIADTRLNKSPAMSTTLYSTTPICCTPAQFSLEKPPAARVDSAAYRTLIDSVNDRLRKRHAQLFGPVSLFLCVITLGCYCCCAKCCASDIRGDIEAAFMERGVKVKFYDQGRGRPARLVFV